MTSFYIGTIKSFHCYYPSFFVQESDKSTTTQSTTVSTTSTPVTTSSSTETQKDGYTPTPNVARYMENFNMKAGVKDFCEEFFDQLASSMLLYPSVSL